MTCPVRQPVRMAIFSTPDHLPVVRAAVEKMCELLGFSSALAGRVMLSSDEALSNIIKHAYRGATDRPIDVEIAPVHDGGRDGIRITLRDWGAYVGREQMRSRDLDDVRPGGLGVHIMCEYMDQLDYQPAEGGGTLLTMVKNLPEKKEVTP